VFARQSNGTLRVETDDHGLAIEADLGGTEIGRGLYEEIKGGYTDKMSFGFRVNSDRWEDRVADNGDTIHLRTITEIGKVYDVSAVSIPANDATSISVRNLSDGVIAKIQAERLAALELEKRKLLFQIDLM
jgi:HK97 family phage prohead protease